jgi:hypothetical protein
VCKAQSTLGKRRHRIDGHAHACAATHARVRDASSARGVRDASSAHACRAVECSAGEAEAKQKDRTRTLWVHKILCTKFS